MKARQAKQKVSRRGFMAGAGAAILTAAVSRRASAADKRPNILFIFTDQERFDLPKPSGLTLPGHDRLKHTGTTFTNHHVGAVMCSSSRAILMTGLQTPDNGVFENLNVPWVPNMSTKIPTIGHMLRKAGYYTAYKGKWHLTREFDEHNPTHLFTAEMEEYGFADYASPGDIVGHTLGGYEFDDLIADSAITWMRRKGRPLNDAGKPWCLTLSLVNPHDIMYLSTDLPGKPVQDKGDLLFKAAPVPEHKFYAAKWDVPVSDSLTQPFDAPGRPRAHGDYQQGWDSLLGHIPPEEWRWRRFEDFYINSVRSVDMKLTRLLNELDALGIGQNTIIIYTADHGEMSGAHGLRNKGPFAYAQNVHVPFYVVHPDVRGGQSSKALTSHMDVAPTILGLAGVQEGQIGDIAGRELPGKSIAPVLSRPSTAGVHAVRDSILFTYSGLILNDGAVIGQVAKLVAAGENPKDPAVIKKHGIQPNLKKRGSVRMVYDGRYKFTRYFSPLERNLPSNLDELYANNDVELFDLEKDPKEITNLAPSKGSNDKLAMAMSDKLQAAIKAEIGVDNGREMPDFKGISWVIDTVD